MSDEIFADRRKALEESFFAKQNEALTRRLREQKEAAARRQELRAVSGIGDDAVLDTLVAHGVGAAALAAVALVPLVEVAWADGEIDAREREAVLRAAGEGGLEAGADGHALLSSWLERKPPAELLDAWKAYVAALCAELAADERARLRGDLLGRARAVAEAAGGFLGLGRKVSPAEQQVLDRLGRAFD